MSIREGKEMRYTYYLLNSNVLFRQIFLGLCIAMCMAGCGIGSGGDGSEDDAPVNGADSTTGLQWIEGVFDPASTFEAKCESPRNGIDLATGSYYADMQGTALHEKYWQRSWSQNVYLWYDEIIDRNPIDYSLLEYFDLLKTEELLSSGEKKDKYHYTYPTEEYQEMMQSGITFGYGVTWIILRSTPPRDVRVAFTEEDTTATNPPANLSRGARVLNIDDVDVVNAAGQENVDILNAALFPESDSETHSFTVQDLGSDTPRTFSLQSGSFVSTPVQFVQTITTLTGYVGYMLFKSHNAIAEGQLIEAVEYLSSEGITDLVLDLRYNSGGLLLLASQLAYMVAGREATYNQVFYSQKFNDKHSFINPFSGTPIEPMPFIDITWGYSTTEGQPLPTLDLNRLFVLTTANTCSASEALINGLRGVGLDVIQIGTTTCGKPYGMYAQDNCGTTYLTISFAGENAQGFGEYPDGFSPGDDGGADETTFPGCRVADDFNHLFGDPEEAMLATALFYRENGYCPEQNQLRDTLSGASNDPVSYNEGDIRIPPPFQNAIME